MSRPVYPPSAAGELADLRRRIAALERAPRLPYASIDSGALVAGDPAGDSTSLSLDGLTRTVIDPESGEQMLTSLGPSGADVLTVTDPTNRTTAQLDGATGQLTVQAMDVAGELTVSGEALGTLFGARGRGLIAYGDVGSNGPEATGECGWFETTVQMQAGRMYLILSSDIYTLLSDISATWSVLLRTTFDGSTPTITSQQIAAVRGRHWPEEAVPAVLSRLHRADRTETWRILLCYRPLGVPAGTTIKGRATGIALRAAVMVYDIGPIIAETNQLNSGGSTTIVGGTATTPTGTKQQYKYEYPMTWLASFRGDGSLRTDTTDGLQGYSKFASGNGNQMAWIGGYMRDSNGDGTLDRTPFVDMGSNDGKTTVDKVEAYLYYNQWYFDSGGTSVIGVHKAANKPSAHDGSLDNVDEKRVSGWPKPGGKWVEIPSVHWQAWHTGDVRGIVIGPGPTNEGEFYGRINGAEGTSASKPSGTPAVRITYTR